MEHGDPHPSHHPIEANYAPGGGDIERELEFVVSRLRSSVRPLDICVQSIELNGVSDCNVYKPLERERAYMLVSERE